jgi:hypothetical protein
MPFNDDYYLQEMMDTFIKDNEVELLIETGTYKGDTTKYLATHNKPVITTELVEELYKEACDNTKEHANITALLGDSTTLLQPLLPSNNEKVFFFLDSHGANDRSLDRELDLIAESTITPFIAIHDFLVPGTSLGYDSHDGQAYSFEVFKDRFDKIYKQFGGYVYHYNDDKAVGSRRGCIFLKPLPKK